VVLLARRITCTVRGGRGGGGRDVVHGTGLDEEIVAGVVTHASRYPAPKAEQRSVKGLDGSHKRRDRPRLPHRPRPRLACLLGA
jgi:hypothetical protein